MPEIKKSFLRGRMNKDLDERLLPDGEYRDASNIQISSTEGSDAGTVQNILGNSKLPIDDAAATASYLNFGDNAVCVGSMADEDNGIIYVFLKGDSIHGIVEYDISTKIIRPLIIDNRDNKNLSFSGNKITGICILEGNLFFTDSGTPEPKSIDIRPYDSSTHTDERQYSLFKYYYSLDANKANFTDTTIINSIKFKLEDITVIKPKPRNAPTVTITKLTANNNKKNLFEDKFVRFAYRWKFKNNQYSPISQFTETVFDPNLISGTAYDLDKGYNNKMLNNIETIKLSHFDVSPNYLESVDILYKEANNANIYIYKTIEDTSTLSGNAGISITKESVYSVLPENQLLRHYDNVPYKAKALDAVGNRIVFGNYTDGLNVENWEPDFNIGKETANTRFQTRVGVNDVSGGSSNESGRRTIKSGRNYQIGIAFEDQFGRQTPVLSNDTGLIKRNFGITAEATAIAADDANTSKQLEITMAGSAPTDSRITHFKYYIKDPANEYYNLIADSVYEDNEDSSFLWIAFPSYEVNKIKEDDEIILKKTGLGTAASSISNYTVVDATFKVLDISESTPINTSVDEKKRGVFFVKIKKNSFIETNLLNTSGAGGFSQVIEPGGAQNAPSGSLNLGFNDHYGDRYNYYYKDGNIFEIQSRTSEESTAGNLPQSGTFQTIALHNVSNCTLANNSENWYRASNDSQVTQAQLTAAGVTEIFYQTSGPTITKAFICYGASSVASAPVPAIFETIPNDNILDIYYETEKSYPIADFGNKQSLLWYNAFNFGDGIESDRIRDDFNEVQIDTQVKVSTTIDEGFTERNNTSGLIYSGLFNANNGVNNLNQFNTGEKISKNLNIEYGDIQKLFTRNTDIIAFCEEKVLRILANKDALYNADGNVNLTASANVLGQAIAYSGDYGISKNPESFASHGHRAYFTDKSRGAVLRLSKDGLTLISDKGMAAFFRNTLSAESGNIIGSYDIYSDQYILTMPTFGSSISFKEDVDGWPSRLTFLPESGASLEGEYYTCYKGQIYLHNAYGQDRNTFYGIYEPSGLQLIFNQEPSVIKNFKNISYEGTSGWTTETDKTGIIVTDQQDGQIVEFKEKEGKYFGTIHGIDTKLDDISGDELDSRLKDFSIQGLGSLSGTIGVEAFTCTDAGFAIANSNTTTDGTTAITSLSQSTVTAGTISSVTPTNMVVGASQYAATITVPDGYSNSGGTITCYDDATGTAVTPTFSCTTANLQINNGAVGATVTGSVSAGTISSFTPNTYQLGSYTYTAVVAAPGSGYTNNSANVSCTGTATGTAVTCGYTLSHNGTYASGGTTITGSSFGSSYGNSDVINLAASTGNICIGGGCTPSANNVNTTKSALAGGLAIVFTEGAELTATTTSGLCSDTKTLTLPQTGFYISGDTAAFTYDSHILTAAHPSTTMTSWQWHKSTSSGFTPSNSTLIAGATSQTYDARETSEDTIYYEVYVNGSTYSEQKAVVFSNRTQLSSAKFKSGGTSADLTACDSSTTKNIFVKPLSATLQTATEFFSDVEGNKSELNGTYSMSVSGTNKYRYVNANGTPGDTYTCGTSGEDTVQKIGVRDCRNLMTEAIVDVTIPVGEDDLDANDVISFTTASGGGISGYTYFYVTTASASGTADATRTWSTTHTSCLVADPPTIDLAGSASAFAGATITLNAQPEFTPQGATFTYVYKKSTDGSTPSTTLATTTNANTTDTAPSAAGTNKYTVEIQGTSPLIKSDVLDVPISLYHAHELYYASGGSISNSACTAIDTPKDVFANINYIAGTITQLYSTGAGSTSNIDAGTYSDGNIHGYFNASGVLQNQWLSCPTQTSPTTTIKHNNSPSNVTGANPYAAVALVATDNDAFGPNKTYSWTKAVGAGSSSPISSADGVNYSAELTNTEKNSIGTGTITHTYGATINDGTNSDTDTINVTWQGLQQDVVVRKCVTTDTSNYYMRLIGVSGWPVNAVLNLTGSGITDGCYKITDASSTGQSYTSVTIAGGYPFTYTDDCCTCSSCSVTVTSNADDSSGNGIPDSVIGTSVTLTAGSLSGFTIAGSNPTYKWERRQGANGSWVEQTAMANSATPSINEANSSAGDYYYRVSAYGSNSSHASGIRATSDAYRIDWVLSETTALRSFQLQNLLTNCTGVEPGGAVSNGKSSTAMTQAAANAIVNNNTVVTIAGDTTNCWEVIQEVTYSASHAAYTTQNNCSDCYTTLTQDCSFTMSVSQTYTSGGATFTGVIGSSAAATDTISLEATDGSTVSPTATTVSALESGLFVTIGSGKSLKATITNGTCINEYATRQAPIASCHQITVYYSTANPATSSSAKSDLCGTGPTETRRFNASTLASSTQVYSSRNDCTTLLSGVRYFSFDNTNYHVWNGNSLSGAVALNCDSNQQ